MTSAEAIAELKRDIELDNDFTAEYINAVNMAIKALEQQPCEDAVSREFLLCDLLLKAQGEKDVSIKWLEKYINSLPLVTPQEQRWIPVSERLPEEAVRVLVYAERNSYDEKGKSRRKVIDIGWQVDERWHIDGCNGVEGIAWMPLPKEYESQETETWDGIHAQITAPKGTFDRLFNEADDDDDI